MSDRIGRFVEAMAIRPGDRVLEIGCGHGVAADLVCGKLGKQGLYVAVDRSAKMLAAARKRNAAHVQAGIARFIEGDFESVDLGAARFDKVFAMRVRLFFTEPDRAAALASRWLAPRGRLYVQYDEPAGS